MNEEQQNPKPTDAVLGGKKAKPQRGAVLGGIEGLKNRLQSPDQQERIIALQQAINYGDEGLKLLKKASFQDRKELAKNPNTPEATLQQLALNKDREVCEGVALNPNTPEEALQQLAKEASLQDRIKLASNPNMPVALLKQLALDEAEDVRCEVVLNFNTPLVRLYVGNLPKDTVEREELQEVFGEASESLSIKVIKDRKTGSCRGFAFVIVPTDEMADEIIEKHNGQTFRENALKIEKVLRKSEKDSSKQEKVALLQQLALDESSKVRERVARNCNTPEETLQQLALDEAEDVRREVASNRNTPEETLQQLALDEAEDVRCEVVLNFKTPQALLQQLALDANAPEALLQQLALDRDRVVRGRVASNPKTPETPLQQLARDEDKDVRWEVASNPKTPEAPLQQLARDEYWSVRRKVAENDNTPEALLQQLAQDENGLVRDRALETLRQRGLL